MYAIKEAVTSYINGNKSEAINTIANTLINPNSSASDLLAALDEVNDWTIRNDITGKTINLLLAKIQGLQNRG